MNEQYSATLTHLVAQRLRERRVDITSHWLERLAPRIDSDAQSVFPSRELLDHLPVLLDGIADYIENPADDIHAGVPVVARAVELGALRFEQGFDATEILREYEILGGILFAEAQSALPDSVAAEETRAALQCGELVFRAVAIIAQITTAHYLRMLAARVSEREERLRRFNRMLTHELKNRVGAVLGAGQLLEEHWLEAAERRRFVRMVTENAQGIQQVLENLIALTHLEGDRRRQKSVLLKDAIADVLREMRELSQARHVDIVIDTDLPPVEVNAAAVELCLSNYLTNAIKYADMQRHDRWARVIATVQPMQSSPEQAELLVRVLDNGTGVPEDKRGRLFERFYRGHDESVEGTGLGLSLVRETVESFGGRAWAEFDSSVGACFAFTLPCRRRADRAGARGREVTEAA